MGFWLYHFIKASNGLRHPVKCKRNSIRILFGMCFSHTFDRYRIGISICLVKLSKPSTKNCSNPNCPIKTYDSISEARRVLETLVGCASFNLNTLSITEISVDVELIPTNALQSLTTQPAPSTSLPRFTVPA